MSKHRRVAFGGFIHVTLHVLFQLIFVFPLFLGAVMYANVFETKEKQKLTEMKNYLQHTHQSNVVIIRTMTKETEEVETALKNVMTPIESLKTRLS